MRIRRLVAVGATALMTTALMAGVPEASPGRASADPAVPATKRMDAAVRMAAGVDTPTPGARGRVRPLQTDGRARVLVYVAGTDVSAARTAVTAAGGVVSDANGDRVRAAVPAARLRDLAARPGVLEVERPETPQPLDIVSEGAQSSGALAWHGDGKQGGGVKVGILDVGFGRLAATQEAGELPADVTVHNGQCAPDAQSSHGTTMAEVVHDMAPAAQLYLACVTDSMDFDDAARWLTDQGVQVVNVSLGFPGTGRGSGAADPTEPDWTPATVVAWLRGQGIVVVTAAGNEADKHMTGQTADPDGNGWMNISGAAENQGFTMAAGARATVELKWDAWPRTNNDLDVFVMDQLGKPTGLNDPHLVAYSINPQQETAGGRAPVETVTFDNTAGETATYWIYVQRKQGAATNLRYDLTLYGPVSGVSYVDPAGSIAEPAGSPYTIAVGAITPVNAATGGTVEGYSSQGPTIDGRVKPDVVGFTNVSTFTGGVAPNPTAGGTSVAAAHVTGAAALYKGANPSLDPAELEALLLDSSDRFGRSNTFGSGVLKLGSPRVPTPSTGSAFTAFPSVRRVLNTADDTGGHRGALQPGETFTLRLPDLPPDATAVMVDITSIRPAADTQLEVFADTPSGIPTLYAEKGRVAAAFVTATLHPQDKVIRIRNTAAATDVTVDFYGYYSEQSSASTFVPKTLPYRLMDTRTWGIASPKLDAGETRTLQVRGVAGVPDNATSVLVNVRTTDASQATHVGLYAQNFLNKWMLSPDAGEDLQTLTLVPIADDGAIRIRNYTGQVHVAVDLVGWYATGGAGARYVPLRYTQQVFNSQSGTQTPAAPFGPASSRGFQMTLQPRVPSRTTAVVLGTTVRQLSSGVTAGTNAALWCRECGWQGHSNVSDQPLASPTAFRTVGNATVAPLGTSGVLGVRNADGTAHISAALYGFFVGGELHGATPLPAPTGWWTCDEATRTTVADSSGNAQTATLQGGTSRGTGGRIGRACTLDGTSGYATTAGPMLRTDQSFSVAAWAYLTRNDKDYTVVAQDGAQTSPFTLQYDDGTDRWVLRTATTDAANAGGVIASAPTPARVGEWTHLVGVYDAVAHTVRLYVNGALAGEASGATLWRANGSFAIGRGKVNGGSVDYFAGHVDEVRTYDRALTESAARELHAAAPAAINGQWAFDEGSGTVAHDSSWRGLDGTLSGGASWTAGVAGQAVQLNGTSAFVGMPQRGPATMDSFTVTAWAKLDRGGQCRVVLSQDGTAMSGFYLLYCPTAGGSWQFGAVTSDIASAPSVVARGVPPTLNEWTHLAGVYDAGLRMLRLYVNGRLVAVVDGVTLWNASGGLVVGRAKANGAPSGYFAGAIDETHVYTGILTDAQIGDLADY